MGQYYNDEHRYDDIINLPHHRSKERRPMPLHDRAAQFAPFMALSGYEDAIEETARLTEIKMELDESEVERINQQLYEISQHLSEKWTVSISYFRPDSMKAGGSYLTDVGTVKKIDEVLRIVVMENGVKIGMEQIVGVKIVD